MRVGRLRRVGLAAVAVAVLVVPATAPAAPILETATLARPSLDGTLQGSSTWSPAVQNCGVDPASGFAAQGTFNASFIGRGTYSAQISRTSSGSCPSGFDSGPPFSVGGTVTFNGPGGSFVATIGSGSTGSANESPHATEYDFHLLLSITGGTRRYGKASGSMTLDYSTVADFASPCPCPADHGSLTGAIDQSADSTT
jgi:hypothetical protein